MAEVHIHRAGLVLPMCEPPIEDGAVILKEGRVLSVGRYNELKKSGSSHWKFYDHGSNSVIIPGLVNCHSHLELTWVRNKISQGLGFGKWLKSLMNLLHKDGQDKREKGLSDSILDGICQTLKNATALLGDVSNHFYLSDKALCEKLKSLSNAPFIHSFVEVIHPVADDLALTPINNECLGFPHRSSYSAHSVYTCSRKALMAIKSHCKSAGLPFSIHLAESKEEIDFVRNATGPIASILKERGRDIRGFFKPAPSPVKLLKEEGLLDDKTLCVHCTFIDSDDLDLIHSSGAWICLCPDSNLFITGELPPVDKMFSIGARVCIGTDSLASSTNLSILSQLRTIFKAFPQVHPGWLFEAATLGGARALGLDKRFGSIFTDSTWNIFVVKDVFVGKREIFEYLCSEPVEERIEPVGT